jgi:hypothetical protein
MADDLLVDEQVVLELGQQAARSREEDDGRERIDESESEAAPAAID